MDRAQKWWIGCLMAMALVGCGKSGVDQTDGKLTADKGGDSNVERDGKSPQEVVANFMEAFQKGDAELANAMLTPLAREMTQQHDLVVSPPGSETGSFKIGDVEEVAENGVHVECSWTDVDDAGEEVTEEMIYVVENSDEGWRIAGMIISVFDGEEPLVLDFSDPEDMIRKQQLVEEEMARREQQATQGENPDERTAEGDPFSESRRK